MKRFSLHLLVLFILATSRAVLFAQQTVPLIPAEKADTTWTFSNGPEFPGATGSLSVDPTAQREGRSSLKVVGDFTKGGKYVLTGRKIDRLDIRELSFWLRYPGADRLTMRIHDATNQTHQISVKLEPGDDWQHVVLPLQQFFARRGQSDAVTSVTRYESWGGAKDGKWHGPASAIYLLISNPSGNAVKTLWLNDLLIHSGGDVATAPPPGFKSDFKDALPKGWSVTEGVSLDASTKGRAALLLSRPLDKVDRPISATGLSFNVVPGQWSLAATCKADLSSSDSSYNAVVTLECLDTAGKVLERITVADLYGQRDWQPVKKTATIPKGVAAARFHVVLNKTWGEFRAADLSATYVAPAPKDERIVRLLFSTAQLGNLLFPNDPRTVNVAVEARQPLPENQRTLTCTVHDYWGAEQAKPVTVAFSAAEKKGNVFVHSAALDLKDVPLEVGRYYEIHASIPQDDGPFRHSTSFAILPEAENKRYKPEDVPFTARNWDNRSTEYIRLSDRLGVRICGLWGSWSSKPPYTAEAPKIELVRELGMGWLTTTPCKFIEDGKRDYDEQALRQGVRNLIAQFGNVRPLIINLGNEPHGTGERVRANVAAYRAVYEEVKNVDPSIPVVATSVEPNEEYFQLGYGQWCDAFDFHVYESAASVRKTIEEYRALMKKYDCVKPIWSTELGLNSQGQTRQVVAVELVKKFTTFFAAGGTNVSWFGRLYPDPEGKSFGSSGDSHNVFDCRFNRYAPRLDAIAYYNMVNAIGIKRFVEEKTYADGIHAFLFRDREGRALQVLWKDKGRQDVTLPLPGAKETQLIRIDGTRRALAGGDVALTISEDPILLLYASDAATSLPSPKPPIAAILEPPAKLSRQAASTVTVSCDLPKAIVGLVLPPMWTSEKSTTQQNGKTVTTFKLSPPANTSIREAQLAVTLESEGGQRWGELSMRLSVQP